MNQGITGIIEFIRKAEKLKTELRHSWTSDLNRRESVAEHTWSACLLAITLFDEISIKVQESRTLKMIIIHDLGEAIIGDIPVFEVSKRQNEKFESERKAVRKIVTDLTDRKLANEIVDLWEEFEEKKTPEAILARACDKLDVLLQHLNTDIKTWDKGDYQKNPYYCDSDFNFDSFIRELKVKVNFDIMKALEDASLLDKISQEHRRLWREQKSATGA